MSAPTKEDAAKERERRKEIARKAAYKAPPESARLIVELGQERLKALQTGGIALDNRTTQVAAFQLAAAAFSAGFTVSETVSVPAATLAGTACAVFLIGSALAFWGIRSCDTQVAGVDPTFWTGILDRVRFTDKLARSWAAEVTEDCIVAACTVDRTRGRWLDRSLIAGAAGASLMIVAVGANLGDRWTKPAAPAEVLVATTIRQAEPGGTQVLPTNEPPKPAVASSGPPSSQQALPPHKTNPQIETTKAGDDEPSGVKASTRTP